MVMQHVIYADVLVFLNTYITFLILLCVKDLCCLTAASGRLVTGALIGGAYSLIILAPSMPAAATVLTRFLMSSSIIVISFGIRSKAVMLKAMLIFYGASFVFAGAAYFISCVFPSGAISYNNGYGYADISAFTLIAVTGVSYAVFRFIRNRLSAAQTEDYLYSVEVRRGERKTELTALYDSADSLVDIYTGSPVIIMECEYAEQLLSDNEKRELHGSFDGGMSSASELKLRYLPVGTLTGENMLPAFTADEVFIEKNGKKKRVASPCIAVCEKDMGSDKYFALINKNMIK